MVDESDARHLLAEFERHADGLLANFTGREWLVERVRAWQADPYAKPFLLIQGTAGIGKSAFAAHLWRTQRMVTAVHFCIAGRGGTTEPLAFVEVLSAQLAAALPGFAEVRRRVIDAYARQTVQIQAEVQTGEVHPGGRVTGVAVQFRLMGIPVEQAFDLVIRRPLRELSEVGSLPPVLLLVDALDEALTHHTPPNILHLLQKSGDLPPQVRWVLTSRPEPKVTQALADLPVEILDAADPRHQADVRQYLRGRVGELEQTARAWGMGGDALVEYLGQRSEWNFLYLTSVWPDLAEGRIPSPEKLPVGLDGYYRYLLDTRVGADAWQEWGADLMEVLLALQEPVDLETLASFLGWEPRLTHQRVLQVAQVLSPALLQEGRYFRHHWSLAEFLRDRARAGPWWCDLTGKHRQIAESILSGWGGLEAGLPGLRSIEEANYGTRHLVTHLIEGGEYEQVARLLRLEWKEGERSIHAWHAVHERLGTPQDFERNLQRAWEAASAINGEAARQGQVCPKLGDEIRYALIEASLHSLVGNIPPELLVALVEKGMWTPTAALAYARQMPDEGKRALALAGLAPRVPEDLLREALAAAREIRDEDARARALTGLAPHLPQDLREQALQEALATVREIGGESARAEALTGLSPHLSQNLLQEALATAREIRDEDARARALAGLAPHLPQDLREQALREALAAAREIGWEFARACALAGLAPHLPEELREQALDEALATAREIRGESARAEALTGLSPYLPQNLLQEALATAREIRGEDARAMALTRLAPHLPEGLREQVLDEALAATRKIEGEPGRAEALAGLAPHLSQNLQREALAAARKIRGGYWRAEALAGLFPRLPENLQREALDAARKIRNTDARAMALTRLAPHLPEGLREQVLDEALAATRKIEGEPGRAEALAGLAPHLPDGLLWETLATAREIRDEDDRACALAGLAPHLPEALLWETLVAAREIGDITERDEALATLAFRLTELGHHEEALAAARKIRNEYHRAHVLAALAPYLLEEWQEQALHEAMATAREIREGDDRARTSAALALLVAELGHYEEALAAARKIRDGYWRIYALAALALHLPEGLREQVLDEAMAAARKIRDGYWRTRALATLALHLPEGLREQVLDEALAAAKKIRDEDARACALVVLALHPPQGLREQILDEALATTREIRDEFARACALAGLALRLAELGRCEEALAAARKIGFENDRARALAKLAPHLPEDLLQEALAAARGIGQEDARAWALAGLALRLAELPRPALYSLWAETLPVLARCTRRDLLPDIRVLEPVIYALGGEEAIVETFYAIQDVGCWWP